MDYNITSPEGHPAPLPRLPGVPARTLGVQATSDGRSDVGRVRRSMRTSGSAIAQASPNSDRARMTRNRLVTMTLASLNIRGVHGGSGTPRNKLSAVAGRMKTEKWSIIALQETHESERSAAELERANPRVWAYPNPGTTFSAGTMFLVHKDLLPDAVTEKEDITSEILIPGRAQALKLKWKDGEEVTIVCIYAPNGEREAISFYTSLRRKLRGSTPIILGDFNHVEHEIDRQPPREPHTGVREALADLRTAFDLRDGWRCDNPGSHAFTWASLVPTQDVLPRSRLDRILVPIALYHRSLKWEILPSLALSDHSVITVQLIDDQQPEMGPVRWRMAKEEVDDPTTITATRECLIACEAQIALGADPMRVWLETKTKIRNIFENVKRSKAKERTSTLRNLEADLKRSRNSQDYHTRRGVRDNAESVESRIEDIKKRMAEKASETTAARYQALGEAVNKYWFSTGKPLQSRQMVRSMKTDQGDRVTDSRAMLEVARDYHEKLMTRPPMTRERTAEIEKIKTTVSAVRLSERSAEVLADQYSLAEVNLVIKVASTGKAPGRDGITYEFYKKWKDMYDGDKRTPKKEPSIAGILHAVWNAESKRISAPAEYVQGLMALAYKKGDKERPENYRPLTLLDTDYKLETKVLATRMGLTLPEVLHRDQAGFVPGRDILDHVKMAQAVAEYCEVTETNGCLIAMDQEKAYDRIDHAYMWEILNAYGLPAPFLQRVKALYDKAKTRVSLNRWESAPFRVDRGVRQGDPMSCLLFDLAIEPLAETLRQSGLRGVKMPGETTRIICKLFADDTQIYLNGEDDWAQAEAITEGWCLASTAKFNTAKTEVLPMGKASYRRRVKDTRTAAGRATGTTFPDGAKVFDTGESIRILGGRIGYNVDPEEIWEPTVQRMEAAAKRWSGRHLTMKGRTLITSFLVLSKGQYLMATNPPSKVTVKRVEKLARRMMWGGKKSAVTLDVLYKPIAEGGLALPDFDARATAARLMWIKRWRLPLEERPQWASLLDETLRSLTKTARRPWMVDPVDQTWEVKRGHNSPLTKDTREMLKLVRKHNVRIDALRYDRNSRAQMNIWRNDNFNATPAEENTAEARLLWKTHGVTTQAQLYAITATATNGCTPRTHARCVAAAERWKAKALALISASTETPVQRRTGLKDNLDLTARRIQKNIQEARASGAITLDPSVIHAEDLAKATRIFGDGTRRSHPTFRQTNLNNPRGTTVVYTDGSADRNGKANSKCGAGLWSVEPELRGSYRIAGTPQSNNRGELAAVVIAMAKAPLNVELLIKTDSMYVLNFLNGGHKKLEDRGWIETQNVDLLKRALYLLRRRTAPTQIQKVLAHSGHMGNEFADKAAKAALELEEETDVETRVPPEWQLTGAKLASLTYHDMYQWVRALKEKPLGDRTAQTLGLVALSASEATGDEPYEREIWEGLRSSPIRRITADFLWRAIHGRTVCGPYFRHWGGEWAERQYCECGSLETLEHILVQCQERTWRGAAWDEYLRITGSSPLTKGLELAAPGYHEILAIGTRTSLVKNLARLEKILITETAYQVWKLRNVQRIAGETIAPVRARNAVRKAILERAKEDYAMLAVMDLPTQKLARLRRKVGATWRGLISSKGRTTNWVSQDFG